MKSSGSREVILGKSSMDGAVDIIRGIVGDMMTEERIKMFLLGADGDTEIALNHALNYIEKEPRGDTSAALQKLLEGLAEEVKCSICLGYLSQPVALHCLHSFCLDCIKEYASTNCISCPLCRKQSPLDERGVEGLKQNSSLANIIDKLRSSQATRLCGECEEVVCSVYCVECGNFLCEDCERRTHANSKNRHQCKPFEDVYTKDTVFLPRKIGHQRWRPEYALSFNIKAEQCEDILHHWLGELWFAPFHLESRVQTISLESVFLPFWQYNCPLSHRKKDEHVLPTATPSRDILLLASRDVDHHIAPVHHSIDHPLIPLTGLNTSKTRVARIDRSAERAWQEVNLSAAEKVTATPTRAAVVFLPCYRGCYTYRDREYQFVVCGVTGKCRGERPYSYGKLSIATGLGAAISIFTSTRIANT
ncbi:hypothetical protein PROFUN_15063 [Planoprotostelium fungivorum]|nr:hypothetical protein PROFUN_15063 [Planoprotostelium fungivorum]